ncbi:chromate resistance protein [Pseudonocardia aurantiaca]|uniref:Chromate resistance protein ChrB domain-containing protein n=1 Tax=Pseudonocardia aurantiaca TaxID=75290 RepID=A0ABW4FPE6_9PSEU
MNWVTPARPATDRIACMWLIRCFIDRDAVFQCVPEANVLEVAGLLKGNSFDTCGADYSHLPLPGGGHLCTLETLIAAYHLEEDPALVRLAKIVHAAGIACDLHTDPLGVGLLALGVGGLDVEADDHQLLAHGMFIYDALYAWCRRQFDAATGDEAGRR